MIEVRFFTFLLIFALGSSATAQQITKAALFGQHAEHLATSEKNIYRIFIDMNGDLYPEAVIDDEELKNEGNAQLKVWANQFPEKFKAIAGSYGLRDSIYSKANFEVLQDSIRALTARQIEWMCGKRKPTWLIHGFRKLAYSASGRYDRTSAQGNRVVEQRIASLLETEDKAFFVEVYWDGKYVPLSRGMKSAVQLAKLYRDEAVGNAEVVGYSLRKLFALIDLPSANIISHSAGTHVVSSLLFNEHPEYTTPTPHQADIRIALLAAAASGVDMFKNYHERNTDLAFKDKDNYSIMNVYNPRDFVLKKFGFSRRYGNTSLGCNCHHASEKLARYFAINFPNSSYLEQSIESSGTRSHYISSYVNTEGFEEVVRFLFE